MAAASLHRPHGRQDERGGGRWLRDLCLPVSSKRACSSAAPTLCRTADCGIARFPGSRATVPPMAYQDVINRGCWLQHKENEPT